MTTSSAGNGPGAILYGEGDLELNAGRPVVSLQVTNTGDRAVQVGSHFHFFEANSALRFPRDDAFGMRLDIPSGTAVRFEAGQTHQVTLVPYAGRQKIVGFQGITDGGDLAHAHIQAKAHEFDLGSSQ